MTDGQQAMLGAKHWFTARQGSRLAWWYDGVLPMGIIEAHPEHPPIMHWMDGRDEELKVTADGTPIVEAIEAGHILASTASDAPER